MSDEKKEVVEDVEEAEAVETPSYDLPDEEFEDEAGYWSAYLPPEDGGEPLYIEGLVPNTVLTRRAMEEVPAKMQSTKALLAIKESQENLIRHCIKMIGDSKVTSSNLRGRGLDKYLSQKQMHHVAELIQGMVTPKEQEVHDFLLTVQKGRRRRRK